MSTGFSDSRGQGARAGFSGWRGDATFGGNRTGRIGVKRIAWAVVAAVAIGVPAGGRAEDKLLTAAVDFSGVFGFLSAGAPAFVIAAVKNGETAFAGFGEIADGTGQEPTADTLMRIGSISKVFCGATLASMAAGGEIALTDRLQDRLGWDGVTLPEKDGRAIRIIDLATQASGLPREVTMTPQPEDNPFGYNTRETAIADLAADPLLFAPGTGVLYSNFGFDLLGAALAHTGGKPYADLLRERVLAPNGMADTVFAPAAADGPRLMQGHNFDGKAMLSVPTPETIECAGGLYTTPNDMLKWMTWNLDRLATTDADMRAIDHAAWLYRDGLSVVSGLDEGGAPMDAMGLGWVINMPEGNRPLILQKTGGLQGMFAFVALAPTRGVGVFVAMNSFNVSGFPAMVQTAVDLVEQLAPR